MGILESHIRTSAADFKEKQAAYAVLSAQLKDRLKAAARPEDEHAAALAEKRGKLHTEDRIQTLIDPGSAVLDLAPLAGFELYKDVPPGAGIRSCIAKVNGATCMVIANNPAVKGGTYFPMTVKKHLRAQEIALENRLPCIYLVDSGGAFLPMQAEVFPDRTHFGRIFFNQAQMSSLGIPQISVVLGSCTAGGAYVPAMSDEVIMVRGNATIFLGGPPLVKAATGETVTPEELGGAEVHCKISGVGDILAENEQHALALARRSIASLGAAGKESPGWRMLQPSCAPAEPRYDPAELYGIVGGDLKKTFSAIEVLARLLDESRFDEFKPGFGETLKCGFGCINGFHIGILANDGILFGDSALKAAHFIQLCSQRLVPLLFLQNIVGFMVGKAYEHAGIAKHGAKMVNAVACARVPKFSLTIGGSYGAGNYSMCGRAYDPRFLFTWPNSRISVMGGAQASRVLSDVRAASAERRGAPLKEEELEDYRSSILEKYETEGSPYYATARLWDDGIIDPLNTRTHLSLAFAGTGFDTASPNRFGVFRM